MSLMAKMDIFQGKYLLKNTVGKILQEVPIFSHMLMIPVVIARIISKDVFLFS